MGKEKYKHVSKEQRYQISALLKAGHKVSFIAEQLNLHRSTVYRELRETQDYEVVTMLIMQTSMLK